MGECKKSQSSDMVLVLYLSVLVGAVVCSVLALHFVHQWFTVMSEAHRRQWMPRLCLMIQCSLAVERVLRCFETWVWFNGSQFSTDLLYNVNNCVFLFIGVYGALMTLIITRLQMTFEGSIYQMSVRKVRVLKALIVVCITLQCVFSALNGVPSVIHDRIGKIMIMVGVSLSFMVNVTILLKLDISFSSRIRSIVAASLALDPQFNPSSALGGSTPIPSTMAVSKRESSILPTMDMVNNSSSDSDGSVNFTKQSSLAAIRKASVSQFGDPSHRQLLFMSAKSFTLTLWINLSFLCFTIAAFLFILSSCAEWATVLAHWFVLLAYIILSVSISLGMPMYRASYRRTCMPMDRCIVKVIVFLTDSEVVEIRQLNLATIPDGDPMGES